MEILDVPDMSEDDKEKRKEIHFGEQRGEIEIKSSNNLYFSVYLGLFYP